jgi:hypothetical protein
MYGNYFSYKFDNIGFLENNINQEFIFLYKC